MHICLKLLKFVGEDDTILFFSINFETIVILFKHLYIMHSKITNVENYVDGVQVKLNIN